MASGNPGRNWVVLDAAAGHRMVVRTESLRIPNWHDTGSTSPRSVGEVALIWDTIKSLFACVDRTFGNHFIAPARPEKNRGCGRGARPVLGICGDESAEVGGGACKHRIIRAAEQRDEVDWLPSG
jgi:hypothetical protein